MDILIRAVDSPIVSDVEGMRQGMMLTIRATGSGYGRLETLPPIAGGKWVRIHVTNAGGDPIWEYPTPFYQLPQALQDKILQILNKEYHDTLLDEDNRPLKIRFRRWQILLNSLPVGVRQTLNQTGEYTVDWPTLRSFILDLKNGTTAEDQGIDI